MGPVKVGYYASHDIQYTIEQVDVGCPTCLREIEDHHKYSGK